MVIFWFSFYLHRLLRNIAFFQSANLLHTFQLYWCTNFSFDSFFTVRRAYSPLEDEWLRSLMEMSSAVSSKCRLYCPVAWGGAAWRGMLPTVRCISQLPFTTTREQMGWDCSVSFCLRTAPFICWRVYVHFFQALRGAFQFDFFISIICE